MAVCHFGVVFTDGLFQMEHQKGYSSRGRIPRLQPRHRELLKIAFLYACSISIATCACILLYPLCGLIVGYLLAVTAVQIGGTTAAEGLAAPGPELLFLYGFLALVLCVLGVGYPVFRFVLKRLSQLSFFR